MLYLLEKKEHNDRIMVCWGNKESNDSDMALHISILVKDVPPEHASVYSKHEWGYLEHSVGNIGTTQEAAELFSLFLQDIEQDNIWWSKLPL